MIEAASKPATKAKPWYSVLYIQVIIAIVLGVTASARAEYPERPIHIIVPVAAGGGVDVMARMLAQKLGERLNQTVVVENRPGAAGIIGSKTVIAAAPDGYTLLYTPSSLSLSVVVHQTPPYDVTKDFTPIINVAISPYVLVVNPSVPAHSLKESSLTPRPTPASLVSVRPVSVARHIWPAKCSKRWPGSTWFTSLTRA
jgi:Uncharacterized protein conserved in bacteria